MRKILAVLGAFLSIFLGLAAVAPAQANAPVVTSIAAPAASQSAQWSIADSKMGALPMQNVICVANGFGTTYPMEYVLEKWNAPATGALSLTVRNTCTGYSITNRLTVAKYTDSGSPNCGKFSNLGSYWDSVQGFYIWNQNPVVWLNQNEFCTSSDTIRAHNAAMFVGAILGLMYSTCDCNEVMSKSIYSVENVKYVTGTDINHMTYVYGAAA
jgi:hypothetical protein